MIITIMIIIITIAVIIIIIINITSPRSELSETRPICFKMLPKPDAYTRSCCFNLDRFFSLNGVFFFFCPFLV